METVFERINLKLKSLSLLPVHPLGLGSENSSVSLTNAKVVAGQILLVHCHPLLLVVGASVSNHNLGGVLVRHHNGRLRKSVSETQRVVGFKGFLHHTGVMETSVLVRASRLRHGFSRSFSVNVRVRVLPAGLFKGELHSNGLISFHDDM